MKANYHTHTVRCHHAQGSEEAYILSALKGGFNLLGFADHTPWPYDFVSRIRMLPEELPGYLQTLGELREKYRDRIQIKIGLECEYYPSYEGWLRELREQLDYMLLGVHFLDSDEFSPYVPQLCREEKGVRRYAEAACKAMQTGLFAYLAHPDLFMRHREKWTPECRRACHEILTCCKELGMPVEYNLNAAVIHKAAGGPGFPRREFWEQAADYGVPAIIGVDAHNPELLEDLPAWQEAQSLLTGLGFTLLDVLKEDQP